MMSQAAAAAVAKAGQVAVAAVATADQVAVAAVATADQVAAAAVATAGQVVAGAAVPERRTLRFGANQIGRRGANPNPRLASSSCLQTARQEAPKDR